MDGRSLEIRFGLGITPSLWYKDGLARPRGKAFPVSSWSATHAGQVYLSFGSSGEKGNLDEGDLA